MPNNSMQWTALRAAADAERYPYNSMPDRNYCCDLWYYSHVAIYELSLSLT